MFQKAFLILSASAIIGAGVLAPTATLAQFPGPPPLPGPVGPPPGLGGPPPGLGGPPPQLGLGGPPRLGPGGTAPRPLGAPSDFARVGGPSGFHGVDRAIQGSGRQLQGRTAGYTGGGSSGYGYDRGGWARRWGRYGAQVYGSSGYSDGSDSYGYSDGSNGYGDGCYYAYSQYAGRRVQVCSRD
jgi:hypothetical protein